MEMAKDESQQNQQPLLLRAALETGSVEFLGLEGRFCGDAMVVSCAFRGNVGPHLNLYLWS
jgi:hypothetical protein